MDRCVILCLKGRYKGFYLFTIDKQLIGCVLSMCVCWVRLGLLIRQRIVVTKYKPVIFPSPSLNSKFSDLTFIIVNIEAEE